MSAISAHRRSLLRGLAARRLLDPSPRAVERLESAIAAAIFAEHWSAAKGLLVFRRELSGQLRDSDEMRASLTRMAHNLDIVQRQRLEPDGPAPTVGAVEGNR